MRNFIILLSILFILILAGFLYLKNLDQTSPPSSTPTPSPANNTTIIAENLDTPWAIAFLPNSSTQQPNNGLLVTERSGTVKLIDREGKLPPETVAVLHQIKEIGEGGLLGIALHPEFTVNHYVYLYYTYSSNGSNTLNRVVRMVYQDKQLKDEQIIIDKIPGAPNHNGGRIKFGPDNHLYITTGDAENPSQAQNTSSLGGKILRVTDEGKPLPDNPFGNPVYSYGHRNPQGLAWDQSGQLWSTEHGRSGVLSGLDELNIIKKGVNYGWPIIQGEETGKNMETPRLNSALTTWAPAGAAFLKNSLFFGGLRGQTLYEAVITDDQITLKEHFKGEFGRIREVILGPDNLLYLTTSNKDGRGTPRPSDDKIIKITLQEEIKAFLMTPKQ